MSSGFCALYRHFNIIGGLEWEDSAALHGDGGEGAPWGGVGR